jgi:hypothetical protein
VHREYPINEYFYEVVMQSMLKPFALRFAMPSPPLDDFGKWTRNYFIKGTTRMTGADLARIAAGGIRIHSFAFTEFQYTQFGPVPDLGDSD